MKLSKKIRQEMKTKAIATKGRKTAQDNLLYNLKMAKDNQIFAKVCGKEEQSRKSWTESSQMRKEVALVDQG